MKIQLSQKEVSNIIAKYIREENIMKCKSVNMYYDITMGETGNELIVTIEEDT